MLTTPIRKRSVLCCVVPQCSFSVCYKTRDENQRKVDEFADQWRVRAADPGTGDPADPFDCFYDSHDPGRVIAHKTYSRADVVHCMFWPSLVVVSSAVIFLYLEARRSRLTFCGKKPLSDAGGDGEKSQLKPASSSHHANAKVSSRQHELEVNDRRHHDAKPAVGETSSSKVSVPPTLPHYYRDGRGGERRLDNGQVRSSFDVSVAGTSSSPNAADGGHHQPRRGRRQLHDRSAAKSHSVSSLTAAGVDAGVLGPRRHAGSADGRRPDDEVDDAGGRRPLYGGGTGSDNRLVDALDSTPGRCASETLLDAAI